MAESSDANFLEILSCKLSQNLSSNRIVAKGRRILLEPQALEPRLYAVHDHRCRP